MPRSAQELMKEAGEIARRADLQLAVLATALVIMGVAIGQSYWGRPEPDASAQAARTIEGPKPETLLAETGDGCSISKRSRPISQCLGVFSSHLRAIELFSRRDRLSGNASSGEIKAAKQSLPGWSKTSLRILKEQDDGLKSNAQTIASYIAERTSLDLPGGIKLPMHRAVAPLAWLGLTLFALVYLIERRRLFWRIWGVAQPRRPVQAQRSPAIEIHDLPVWLAPAASPSAEVRRRLQHAAGLEQDPRWRDWLGSAVAVGAMACILAMAFVGANLCYFDAVTTGQPIERTKAWASLWATIAVAGVDLVLLAIAAGVRWPIAGRPPALNQGRRGFLAACFAGGLLATAVGVASFPIRRFLAQPRFRKRESRVAYFTPGQPARGFYKNASSNALHYVGADGAVRQVDARLKPSNLRPLASGAPGRPLRLGEAERVALDLWIANRPLEAISLILATIKDHYPSTTRVRPTLRLLDLAAGMALHSHLPDALDAVIQVLNWSQHRAVIGRSLATLQPPLLLDSLTDGQGPVQDKDSADLAGHRLMRWTSRSADCLAWRAKRWNPKRALTWDNAEHSRATVDIRRP